ncbi:MFS transporter [Pseudonocardia sp. K10HN5]|uniref:MFS transporter n=2 Tax=Pseudonocardia acidicola TaxID=2724939 RepID=A0ABX1SH32_9PSEU|nr:MFS transporter [Pseudonocardia acidicola]NMI00872.1 MFS transporter [Pseudonocardia acidicola]
MLAASLFGFGGYALLLPVVPLWVARGGSGAFGAGATTGVLMLLLGAPSPFLALSAGLGPVLAVSAVRGVGFGLLTVAGSALVAELVRPAEHGRAAALYGFAVGAPQLALLPAGVAVVERVGFTAVFVAGASPLVGMLLVPLIRMPAGAPPPPPEAAAAPAHAPLWRGAVAPVLGMLLCATAQGGLITFLPLAAAAPGVVVPVALFGTAAGAMLGRWVAGQLVDRRGMAGRLLIPGMALAATGMLAELLAAPGAVAGGAVALGAAIVGIGFGLVQNDSLVALFGAAGPARYGTASAVWNIAYDAGTGAGAVGLGAIAEPFGFRAAFAMSALLLVGGCAACARKSSPGRRFPRTSH